MIRKQNIIFFTVIIMAFIFYTCKSLSVGEKHSFGDECRHCHGENLQGIQNVKATCNECHKTLRIKPEEIQVQERKDAVLNGSHPHKTDNMFKSTPSCFFCHRRTDF